jgi:protein tyrosine phosphatase (PTP) superfamily phosphohydrolase (DUF442 family)
MDRKLIAFALALLFAALPALAAPSKPAAQPDSAAVVALLAGVTNGACPLPGVATGGQPAEAHLKSLAKAGFTTVLDLRAADEPRGFNEAAAMKAAKLAYELLPVTPATLEDSTFDRFRALMKKTGGKGVFVHCASGNRVGAVMVPWLVLDRGWPIEKAVSSARAGGLRSPEMEARARDYVSRHASR